MKTRSRQGDAITITLVFSLFILSLLQVIHVSISATYLSILIIERLESSPDDEVNVKKKYLSVICLKMEIQVVFSSNVREWGYVY